MSARRLRPRRAPRDLFTQPPAEFVDPVAVERVLGGMTAGRPLSVAERHTAVARMDRRHLSISQLAAVAGVSEQTIQRDRRALGLVDEHRSHRVRLAMAS